MRLNQFLAKAGAAPSRRKADDVIASGVVFVNGAQVKEQGVRVNPETDEVRIGKKVFSLQEERILLSLHKPTGWTVTRDDPHAERVVYDLLPKDVRTKVHAIGRLDRETSGLLLFTNDGELTQRLTHPSFEHEKEYALVVRGSLLPKQRSLLENGVRLEDGVTAPAYLSQIRESGGCTRFHLTIHEGKKRQIRRMMKELGLKLNDLHRVRVASVELGTLPSGKWRFEDPAVFDQVV
ncbi:MAG: rRNA pseudouridine synthase [Candidatus Doudnabacteria bacterium]|nr:rRNA pseudouridine synthase [Candidatus Doudnabacteria bacterium]MCA9387412.1 rRNA pseudouridine synthase [Candidatus Andersenbacteria bacterium]